MNQLLKEITVEFEKNREELFPVKTAWMNSCLRIGLYPKDPFVKFGLLFSNHPDLIHSENKYHNQVHSADAIVGASFLAKEEFSEKELKINGSILIFAMMCHDIAHNGKHNNFDYELEKAAVSSFQSYIKNNPDMLTYWSQNLERQYGSWENFEKKIEAVILGTDFKNGPVVNLKNYKEDCINLNKIKLLANEADILPSCTSNLGPQLGLLLSQEQNNPGVGSWKGREFFLANLAKFGSTASQAVGIQSHIDAQLAVIQALGSSYLDEQSQNGNFLKVAKKIHEEASLEVSLNLDNKNKKRI